VAKFRHEELMTQGMEMVEFYRNNPCIAAYDLLKVDLAPIQRLIFEDMWFKNYVIVVAGRGLGKSVHTNSLCYFKDRGLLYLNEALPPIPSYLCPGDEEVVTWDDSLYTSKGFRPVKNLCLEKGIIGKKIVTQNNLIQKGSSHHPLLTLNSECEFEYKKLEDFIVGDNVCIQRGNQVFGNNQVFDCDAYLMGLFIGDGCISDEYNFVSITTSDKFIIDFCLSYCSKNNVSFRVDRDKRTDSTVKICFKSFDWFFEKYNVDRKLSYCKAVPYSIRTADRESQIAFLQGYFDADGTADLKTGGVSCCSVSDKLLREIQLMLLNFGIVSRFRVKNTKSEFGKAYLLDFFSEDAYKFKELIGFRLKRKQSLLCSYFENKNLNVNKDVVPRPALELCYKITNFYHNTYKTSKKPSFRIRICNKKELSYSRLHRFICQCNEVENAGFSLDSVRNEINKLYSILDTNYYFDTVTSIDVWQGDCYDFEMDMSGEPNYFSNGFINHNTFLLGTLSSLSCMLYPGYKVGLIAPAFRQSKMIFSEVEKLYFKSDLLKEACEKPPVRGSDSCYLRFKSVGGCNPSIIESLPLGDGGKIRGSRFYLIVVDELAQIPDITLDMVVRPMGATTLEPMENVRRLQRQKQLIKMGLATEEDFEEGSVNKMIMTSSGYYKFNHMWRRMRDHWSQMDEHGDESQYKVWQVPYWDVPPGFLDINNIKEAKRVMSDAAFKMEYEAAMISDSEGFFKASVLDECTDNSGFTLEVRGEPGQQYILGVDPNQGGDASCGVAIIKVGKPNKLINILELKSRTTQELTMMIQQICDVYNVIRIFMDKGGGGKAIMDLLEEGYNDYEPIIDCTDKDKITLKGRHILEMVNFNPSWISDANFTTLSMFEDKKLLFPEPPIFEEGKRDILGKAYEGILTLKKQLLNIVVTQTSSGLLHFDTPKKGQKKDLYSALILAAHGCNIVERQLAEDQPTVLFQKSGYSRPHKSGSSWSVIGSGNEVLPMRDTGLEHAVLKGRRRIKKR
jgi:hypothetical protein